MKPRSPPFVDLDVTNHTKYPLDDHDILSQYLQDSTRSEESSHGRPPVVITPEEPRKRRQHVHSKSGNTVGSSSSGYNMRSRNRRVSILGLDATENKVLDKMMGSECIDGPAPIGCCRRCIFRIKNIPSRIIFRVARQDTRAVKQSLCLFPLSFREADMEKRFIQSRRSTDHIRSWTVGLLCISLVTMFWIAYAVGFSAQEFLKISQAWFRAGMAVALIGCLLFILVDIMGTRIPYGETISLGCLSLVRLFLLISVI